MNINFVTGNKLKFDITAAYFAPLGDDFVLKQLTIDVPEVQAGTVEEVALTSAQEAVRIVSEPCIVSDAGLCIESLGGFPGPFLKYVNQWLGINGYLKLLHNVDNRRAYFEDSLAVAFPDGSVKAFTRRQYGVIATAATESQSGWAANDLFIPDGYEVSLGQLTHEDQVAFWGDGCWPQVVAYLRERDENRV